MSAENDGMGIAQKNGQRGMRGRWEDEIARIREEMTNLRNAGDLGSERLRRLEDINQAVSWASDPDSCKSPFDLVMGIESAEPFGDPSA